jgi:hypothetical protein
MEAGRYRTVQHQPSASGENEKDREKEQERKEERKEERVSKSMRENERGHQWGGERPRRHTACRPT